MNNFKFRDARESGSSNFKIKDLLILSFAFCILHFAILSCKTPSPVSKEDVMLKTAKEVYSKEVQYLKARVSKDLNILYSFQHPEYRAVISRDKFISEDGNIQLNYSAVTEKNPLPQIDIINPLFPAFVKGFRIEKAFMDKKGKYAKFHIVLMMDLFLPLLKGVPVENEFKDIIYWEKVGGDWFILNKAKNNLFPHISGAVTTSTINLPEEKAEYIEVDIKSLL